MEVLVQGVKLARRLAQTSTFAPFLDDGIQPGPVVQSEADIRDYMRGYASTVYHPVGTCKMRATR